MLTYFLPHQGKEQVIISVDLAAEPIAINRLTGSLALLWLRGN
ncbi:hypothetical protein [Nodosilinea sp. LEGE 07088]|nr:hypothetical protein [Nodosilinea sp. LEGE 07088]